MSDAALTFKRGQPLTLNDRPLVQPVYLPDEGAPLALCITRAADNSGGYTAGDAGPMRYASWRAGGFDYVLVGDGELAAVERTAKIARAVH